jgi:DNA-directed RNA polymerase specialized sigma24 family protein
VKDCPDRYACLSDALKLLRNQLSPREALIFIARYYLQLKLVEMEEIFRWDFSHLSRLAHKAERKLNIRG